MGKWFFDTSPVWIEKNATDNTLLLIEGHFRRFEKEITRRKESQGAAGDTDEPRGGLPASVNSCWKSRSFKHFNPGSGENKNTACLEEGRGGWEAGDRPRRPRDSSSLREHQNQRQELLLALPWVGLSLCSLVKWKNTIKSHVNNVWNKRYGLYREGDALTRTLR